LSFAHDLFRKSGAAERLIIEITETVAIQDLDDACGFVTRIKDLGCRIAIDDFGVAIPRSATCASSASTS
jgi:EAL domain-containing protein (putative c-di-GMP-specific phosphodiesterase class I)